MKEVKFEIKQKKPIAIDIPLQLQKKFPVHENYLFEEKRCVVTYKYEPASSLSETAYLKYLKNYLSEKYNTNLISASVEEII